MSKISYDDCRLMVDYGQVLKGAPKVGTAWRHYKGGDYFVLELALLEATMKPVVVYRSLATGVSYARPLEEWYEVTAGGKARFTPISKE